MLPVSSDHPSFHVVALSLPGFGFSEAPKKKGFAGPQFAEVGNKLMLALGYEEYATKVGDWGFYNTKLMAGTYGGKTIKAWHTNTPMTAELQVISITLPDSPDYTLYRHRARRLRPWYMVPSERQQLVRRAFHSAADSPVGLPAWIYEKLVNWTDSHPWEDDEDAPCYVRIVRRFSRAWPAASVRIYYEIVANDANPFRRAIYSPISLGFSFLTEFVFVPRSWSRTLGNVVFESEHDGGGHFAAHEKSEYIAGDLRKMFGKGGPASGVVPGKHGYTEDIKSVGARL